MVVVPTKLYSLLSSLRGADAHDQSHYILLHYIAHDVRGTDWMECDLHVICHRRRHWRGFGLLYVGGLQLACNPMWDGCNGTLASSEHGICSGIGSLFYVGSMAGSAVVSALNSMSSRWWVRQWDWLSFPCWVDGGVCSPMRFQISVISSAESAERRLGPYGVRVRHVRREYRG